MAHLGRGSAHRGQPLSHLICSSTDLPFGFVENVYIVHDKVCHTLPSHSMISLLISTEFRRDRFSTTSTMFTKSGFPVPVANHRSDFWHVSFPAVFGLDIYRQIDPLTFDRQTNCNLGIGMMFLTSASMNGLIALEQWWSGGGALSSIISRPQSGGTWHRLFCNRHVPHTKSESWNISRPKHGQGGVPASRSLWWATVVKELRNLLASCATMCQPLLLRPVQWWVLITVSSCRNFLKFIPGPLSP